MLSNYVIYNDLYITGGKEYTYNEEQCIERCLEDSRCFTIHHYKTNVCYLYRSNNGTTITESARMRPNSKIVIFFDNLKLLSKTFKLNNLRVKRGISSRTSFSGMNETMCFKQCQEDPICNVISFKPTTSNDEINCWLFSEEKVSCQRSAQETCNTLEVKTDSVTWFDYS